MTARGTITRSLAGIAIVMSMAVAAIVAQDSPGSKSAQPAEEPGKTQAEGNAEAPKPDRPPTDASASELNPLETAIARMRDAQKRIEKKDTGKETREIQRQVISDLDKL